MAKAKKELSVEESLRALHNLQKVDSEITKIKTLRGELPLEVQDLEDEIEGLETRINNFEKEIEENENDVASKKNEIKEYDDLKRNAKALNSLCIYRLNFK